MWENISRYRIVDIMSAFQAEEEVSNTSTGSFNSVALV